MKRGGPDHPKMQKLADALKINKAWAVGIMECLIHFTAKYAIQGDIGRWDARVLARAVGWHGSPLALERALLSAGLIDVHPKYRFLLHGWKKHCDQSVRKTLSAHKLGFACDEDLQNDSGNGNTPLLPSSGSVPSFSSTLSGSVKAMAMANKEGWKLPVGFDTKDVRAALEDWFAYLAKRNKSVIDEPMTAFSICQTFSSAKQLVRHIHLAKGNGWISLDESRSRKEANERSDDEQVWVP